jgi:predicted alpha/beta hydrolase family esterase
MQQVANELGPIDAVVTHSFGGPVTGFALLNGFNARRIVLIAPPRGRNKRWFDFAQERGIPDEVVHRAREIYAAEVGLHATFDLAAIASPIETLVLHSMDDDAVEWQNGEVIAEKWPNAELALCDGLGHRMIAQDRSVIDRVVQFVA